MAVLDRFKGQFYIKTLWLDALGLISPRIVEPQLIFKKKSNSECYISLAFKGDVCKTHQQEDQSKSIKNLTAVRTVVCM